MESKEINPVFLDLNNANTLVNHVEQLVKGTEQKTNPFPVDVFPKPVQEIITATNESLTFPIDFISTSILYAVSVSIGNTHRAQIFKGYEQNAVLYLAIVGRPGTNKTHPLKWAVKPIEQLDNMNYNVYSKELQKYDAIAALSKKEREQQGFDEPTKPVWEQILISDFTPEALASVHSYNTRGLGVNVDELASWFKNFNRYNKGSEQEFWLSVWSGNTIKVNRKTSENINIPVPFISVAGTIQPAVLNELAENRTENGFIDRLLFVVPENLKKEYWSEKELQPEIVENWSAIISNLLDITPTDDETGNPKPIVLRFTHEAKQHLFEWQRELTDLSNKPENEAISGIYAKIEMYAIRFALCLEMLQYACNESDKKAIGINSVKGALKLVDYFAKTALKVSAIVTNSSPLDRLPTDKQILYNALPETFTTSEGVKIAESLNVAERTFKYFISNKDLFTNTARGEYEKRF
jgi:hypothetical protein